MIDITRANLAFEEYIKNYDIKNEKIKLKVDHIKRVSKIAKQIATNLNLSREDIELAELIGLLHDIGRFEQVKRYNTFWDQRSVSHGVLGVEVLFEDNRIRNFIVSDKYDKIIKTAILNHNVARVDMKFSNEKEELHSKIIRDADKIDIFYEGVVMFWKGNESAVEESTISPEVFEQIQNNIQVKRGTRQTPVDNVLSVLAFIFDINFKTSFEILNQESYINKMLNRYNMKDEQSKKELEEVRNIANKYVEQKIKESE